MAIYDIEGNKLIDTEPTGHPDFSALQGKYGMHIGDSYTASMTNAAQAFYALDNNTLHMDGCLGYGIVSSTIRDKGAARQGFAYKPMVCRVLNVGSEDTSGETPVGTSDYIPMDRNDIGYITFMGGTNDSYGTQSSLGESTLDGTMYHIYGAMNLILQKLVDSYPSVPIIVILQPPYANQTATESADGVDISKLEQPLKSVLMAQTKQRAVKEVTEVFMKAYSNVYLCDCCFNWYSPMVSSELSTYWASDLLHLTTQGYNEIATGTKYDSVYKVLKRAFATEQ